MTNSKELFNDLVSRITLKEEISEVRAIVSMLLEKKLGLTRSEILTGKEIVAVSPSIFDPFIVQINDHRPIQYILGEAEFYGRIFKVNTSVLIPRPETELLMYEIISKFKDQDSERLRILDIGTGSGCMAVTLAQEIPRAIVHATDISKEAIETAKQNSEALGSSVKFHEHNILDDGVSFGPFDLIVSNPPYISEEEKVVMRKNVLEHEPHLALFAPAKDPLAFYKAIALKSKATLSQGGSLWVEVNEHFGKDVADIFKEQGYNSVRIIKDLNNKDRIVTGRL